MSQSHWKQADVFPLIAGIIDAAAIGREDFVTSEEIAGKLLRNPKARKLIAKARARSDSKKPPKWHAKNMVAWFSQRWSANTSDWTGKFKRIKINDEYAYRPIAPSSTNDDGDIQLPEEVLEDGLRYEGALFQITVNRYERDPGAREKCIAHYGTVCLLCGINFADRYGELGEGFIHVHHLKPLAEIRKSYVVDPINDLRPVCPNCHAMIHRNGFCRELSEIKAALSRSRRRQIR